MTTGLFLEDLDEGQVFVSRGRTVTEADIVGFAGISGDFNPIHMDREHAARGIYGRAVAHGILTLSMVTGLIDSLGLFQQTMVAMLAIDKWRFTAPVFAGDTITLRLTIRSLRRTSAGDKGVVERQLDVLNQDGTVVQTGVITVLVRARETVPTEQRTEQRTSPAQG